MWVTHTKAVSTFVFCIIPIPVFMDVVSNVLFFFLLGCYILEYFWITRNQFAVILDKDSLDRSSLITHYKTDEHPPSVSGVFGCLGG